MKTKALSRSSVQQSVADLCAVVRRLKTSVGQRLKREFRRQVPGVLIERALDEAVETAVATGFPHLFFPALAEERVRLVSASLHDAAHWPQAA